MEEIQEDEQRQGVYKSKERAGVGVSNINFNNKYWRQAAPINNDLDFKTQMKIIKEERETQLNSDIEDYESIHNY